MAIKRKKGPSPARILVVDDDERNLLALTEVLSPLAEVATASSGHDALRLLLKKDFAVILLDVFMPGLDGYETASLIREREQTARIPIIFLSAVNKETEHLMRGYSMGAVDYVFKPVDPLVLKSKVSVFVDLYNMRQQVEEQMRAEGELREAHFQEQINRMEVERQLEDSQRRLAAILKSLPMAIYEIADRRGRKPQRRFVGGDLAHFLGQEASSVVSGERQWEDWIHPEDSIRMSSKGTQNRDSITLEYRWRGPDGIVRHVLDQRVEMPSQNGARRWAGTLVDITERKELEARLVHVGKLDALGQLTGGVAHDFNNLLAAVLGGIQVLERRLKLGEREEAVMGQMRHAAQQGAELVRRMLAFSRQSDLSPASVEPTSLCESVAGLVNHTLGGTVTIDWKCAGGCFNLFADRGQLELALMNLILNARDAMPGGGQIEVAIEPDKKALRGRPALTIRVSDRGDGIPSEIVDKVTEPFFTTKETGKGTGLGLSMVAGFVHQSGGELRIASRPGKGTTVELILPATEASAEQDEHEGEDNLAWLADRRLMLIDDDDSVRLVLTEQFRDGGGIVEQFHSGREAIEAIRKAPRSYDFVLSDFAMPDLDGLETLREVEKVAPNTRLALMTGYAEDLRESNSENFPVIRKPINLKALAQVFGGS